MAETKKTTAAEKAPAEAVTNTHKKVIKAPLGKANEQPLIIGVNGVNWAIPLDGKTHEVPDYVADEYERSLEAQEAFFRRQQNLSAQSEII